MTDTLLGYFDDIAEEMSVNPIHGAVRAIGSKLRGLGNKVKALLDKAKANLIRAAGNVGGKLSKADKNVRPLVTAVDTAVKAYLAKAKGDVSNLSNAQLWEKSMLDTFTAAETAIENLKKTVAESGHLNGASCKLAAGAVSSWSGKVDLVMKAIEKNDGFNTVNAQGIMLKHARRVMSIIQGAASALAAASPKKAKNSEYDDYDDYEGAVAAESLSACVNSILGYDSDIATESTDALEQEIYALECDIDCDFLAMGIAI